MMTSSRFQSGTDSGAATPPSGSPQKGPLVYASVAEMKRKKSKNGTLRGKPCPIPTIGADLKRNFHSTPDLNTQLNSSSSSIWTATAGVKGHHSQDDVNTIHGSMQRLNLPPPNHPPPPPPIGQVVKVDVSRGSEYESTVALQKIIAKNAAKVAATNEMAGSEAEIRSSFNPTANAKLYASPQDIRNVAYRARQENRKVANSRPTSAQPTVQQQQPQQQSQQQQPSNQYAQPGRQQAPSNHQTLQQHPHHHHNHQHMLQQNCIPSSVPSGLAPPIPEPDYSLSESEDEDENSILVARNTKLNEKIALMDAPVETSGNSNTSGSSSGSSSIPHSFSVDEIQKMRTKLKSSKSYPNDLVKPDSQNDANVRPVPLDQNDEGDNSSSGVSSDQEIPTNNTDTIKKKPPTITVSAPQTKSSSTVTTVVTPTVTSITTANQTVLKKQSAPIIAEQDDRSDDDGDQSPSPPAKGFQRHNSLTRKQAAAIAMSRAARSAVSLVQLPPPIEDDVEVDQPPTGVPGNCSIPCPENIVLAPPPQFCDCNDIKASGGSTGAASAASGASPRVRIVGAVPKANRLHSQ